MINKNRIKILLVFSLLIISCSTSTNQPQTTIVDKSQNNTDIQTSSTPTQTLPPDVKVNSISLSSKNLSMNVDKTIKIDGTVKYSNGSSNSNIIWSSSDDSIATIDNTGNIKPLSAGTITITAQAKDDSTKKDTAQVNIKIGEIDITDISNVNLFQPSVSIDKNANFIIVWQNSNDTKTYDIYFKKYDRNGLILTPETRVNTASLVTLSQLKTPSSMDDNGKFAIAWQGKSYSQNLFGIYAKMFDNFGKELSEDFSISKRSGTNPFISMNDKGNFVITWEDSNREYYKDDTKDRGSDIYAQMFDSSGKPIKENFRVNTLMDEYNQENSNVGIDSEGNFVIVWQSKKQHSQKTNFFINKVYAKKFKASGEENGSEFLVSNTLSNESQNNPSLAVNQNGDFAITWQSYDEILKKSQIYLKTFDKNGNNLSAELNLGKSDYFQENASITINNNNVIICWTAFKQNSQIYEIFAQKFNINGNIQGNIIKVDTINSTTEPYHDVAINNKGDVVISWDKYNDITKNYTILAKVYDSDLNEK